MTFHVTSLVRKGPGNEVASLSHRRKSKMAPKAVRKSSSPAKGRIGAAGAFVMDFYRNPTKW